ncbi:MAG: polymorphic toxin-type HINT domain-containing protein [Deinococcaceae bacterium]
MKLITIKVIFHLEDTKLKLIREGTHLTRGLSPHIKSWGKDIALKAKFCRNSFAPSTKVWTKSGLVAIATLFALDGTGLAKQTPDEVWSYNERTQKNELKAVEHVFINEDDYITTLELFDPETRRNETITTTPEHPFYVSSKEREPWTGAGELEVDDEIRKADGNVGIVLFVRTKLQKKVMYNLSVSDNHNFFVGDQGWLTHNANKSMNFSSNWGTFSILDSIKIIGADPTKYALNESGTKKLFISSDGTKQVVYDIENGYYRVQDLTHPGARANAATSYLDQYGKPIPENVPLYKNNKWAQTGVSKDLRNALTHFSNSGPCF